MASQQYLAKRQLEAQESIEAQLKQQNDTLLKLVKQMQALQADMQIMKGERHEQPQTAKAISK